MGEPLGTAENVAESALALVGAFPAIREQADVRERARALKQVDKVASEIAGTLRLPWLRRVAFSVPLVADTADYALRDVTGGVDDRRTIEHWYSAFAVDVSSTSRVPVTVVRAWQWEHRPTDDRTTSYPEIIYIDNDGMVPTLRCYPTPGTQAASYRLDLTGWMESPVLVPDELYNLDTETALPYPDSWRRYLEFAVAVDIGMGPVRTLSPARINMLTRERDLARARLEGIAASENATVRICSPMNEGLEQDGRRWRRDYGRVIR